MYWSIPLHVHTSGNDVFWISFVLLNNDISQLFISVFKQVPPTRLFLVDKTSIIYTAVAVQIRAWCIKKKYVENVALLGTLTDENMTLFKTNTPRGGLP